LRAERLKGRGRAPRQEFVIPKGVFMSFRFVAALFACVWLASSAFAANDFAARIEALEPAIGRFPPDFKKTSKAAIQAQYEKLKRELDAAVLAAPKDETLLAQRGYLQSLGHNFDTRGAWEGATQDLTAAIKMNPRDTRAILNLANLWVNSRPDLAKNAENLFRAAQCNAGVEPLEEAQRGLFFALHYQGRFAEAYTQAQFLAKRWPEVTAYGGFLDMERSVLSRKGEAPPETPSQPVLATCKAN
jgi:tetratricopeptide (TPR) repeat protein